MTTPPVTLEPVSFQALPGWQDEDFDGAFQAFRISAGRLSARATDASQAGKGNQPSKALLNICAEALERSPGNISTDDARSFFEQNFVPHRVVYDGLQGLLTGYYEPVLIAGKNRGGKFQVPILRRPASLVNLVDDADRGRFGDQLTHGFRDGDNLVPCPTREQIETGALDSEDLALAWLECPIEAFFLHVEGSGQLRFDDGTTVRVTYDGKNGYPYTSVGRHLIETGVFQRNDLTFQVLKDWLQADLKRAQPVLWQNKSYIFFRQLGAGEPDSALGVMQIPLTALRSLAVDTTHHEIGSPIFVVAPDLKHAGTGSSGFFRLLIAQDVGSAIRGPERGDIYFGSGPEAGYKAGQTVHSGTFYVLLPKACAKLT